MSTLTGAIVAVILAMKVMETGNAVAEMGIYARFCKELQTWQTC